MFSELFYVLSKLIRDLHPPLADGALPTELFSHYKIFKNFVTIFSPL